MSWAELAVQYDLSRVVPYGLGRVVQYGLGRAGCAA